MYKRLNGSCVNEKLESEYEMVIRLLIQLGNIYDIFKMANKYGYIKVYIQIFDVLYTHHKVKNT